MNLKDLSQILGLSQTTVSRALNGYPEVSEATRARVARAAERHGYRPNMRARSLATGRAMAIGHVIPRASQHEVMNPIFADFIAGASEVYTEHGQDLLISVVPESDQEEAYRDFKLRGTVDGLIVHAPRVNDARIPLIEQVGLPFVVHGRATGVCEKCSWVDVNNQRAFERATEFLLDLGHRRIALVNGLENMDFAVRRRAGYEAALTRAGIAPERALNRSGEMTEARGHRAMVELLALERPPTAVLAASLVSALGVRRAIEEAGLKLGRDISVVCHDDVLGYFDDPGGTPIFTATRSSVRQAGRICARMIIDLIADPSRAPMQHLLEAELVVGQSTGPAALAARGAMAAPAEARP